MHVTAGKRAGCTHDGPALCWRGTGGRRVARVSHDSPHACTLSLGKCSCMHDSSSPQLCHARRVNKQGFSSSWASLCSAGRALERRRRAWARPPAAARARRAARGARAARRRATGTAAARPRTRAARSRAPRGRSRCCARRPAERARAPCTSVWPARRQGFSKHAVERVIDIRCLLWCFVLYTYAPVPSLRTYSTYLRQENRLSAAPRLNQLGMVCFPSGARGQAAGGHRLRVRGVAARQVAQAARQAEAAQLGAPVLVQQQVAGA